MQKRPGLSRIDPQQGRSEAVQQRFGPFQTPRTCPYAHRVQNHRLAQFHGGAAPKETGPEFFLIGRAGIQNSGVRGGGNGFHLLTRLGHNRAGSQGKGKVGAVVGGDQIGDAVDQRTAGPDHVQKGKIRRRHRTSRISVPGRTAWLSDRRFFAGRTKESPPGWNPRQ